MDNPDNSGEIADALLEIANELELFRDAFPRPRPDVTPLVEGEPGYPFAPGTQAQGFLGSRWNRRDGNVYATPAPLTGGNDVAQETQPSRDGRRERSAA
jgi:hypothetical protein